MKQWLFGMALVMGGGTGIIITEPRLSMVEAVVIGAMMGGLYLVGDAANWRKP